MKTKRRFAKGFIVCVFLLSLFLSHTLSLGATFCVSDEVELQTALTTAANNGEDDVIKVLQGIYSGHFEYDSSEGRSISLAGGYTSCSDSKPMPDPSNTILDAQGSGSALIIRIRASDGNIMVEGFTIKNAHSDYPGTGIYAITSSSGYIAVTNNIFMENTGEAAWVLSRTVSDPSGKIVFEGNTFTGSIAEGYTARIMTESISSENSSGNVEFTNNVVEGGLQQRILANSISETGSSGNIVFRDNRIKGLIDARSTSDSGSAGNLLFVNNSVTESYYQGIRAFSSSASGPSGNIELTNNNIISDNAHIGTYCVTQSLIRPPNCSKWVI